MKSQLEIEEGRGQRAADNVEELAQWRSLGTFEQVRQGKEDGHKERDKLTTALRNLLAAVEPYDNDRLEDADIYRAAQEARAVLPPEPDPEPWPEPETHKACGRHFYLGRKGAMGSRQVQCTPTNNFPCPHCHWERK